MKKQGILEVGASVEVNTWNEQDAQLNNDWVKGEITAVTIKKTKERESRTYDVTLKRVRVTQTTRFGVEGENIRVLESKKGKWRKALDYLISRDYDREQYFTMDAEGDVVFTLESLKRTVVLLHEWVARDLKSLQKGYLDKAEISTFMTLMYDMGVAEAFMGEAYDMMRDEWRAHV